MEKNNNKKHIDIVKENGLKYLNTLNCIKTNIKIGNHYCDCNAPFIDKDYKSFDIGNLVNSIEEGIYNIKLQNFNNSKIYYNDNIVEDFKTLRIKYKLQKRKKNLNLYLFK